MPAHHDIQLVCAYVLILMLRPFFWRIPAADAHHNCTAGIQWRPRESVFCEPLYCASGRGATLAIAQLRSAPGSDVHDVNDALSGIATLTVVQLSLAAAERSTRAGDCALRPRAQLAAERMSLLRGERSLRSSRSVNQLTLSLWQLT